MIKVPSDGLPYLVFFLGVALTGLGSGYYHLAPDNETLFWDRLPMTIAFMSLISAQIVDRISIRAGLALLLPGEVTLDFPLLSPKEHIVHVAGRGVAGENRVQHLGVGERHLGHKTAFRQRRGGRRHFHNHLFFDDAGHFDLLALNLNHLSNDHFFFHNLGDDYLAHLRLAGNQHHDCQQCHKCYCQQLFHLVLLQRYCRLSIKSACMTFYVV